MYIFWQLKKHLYLHKQLLLVFGRIFTDCKGLSGWICCHCLPRTGLRVETVLALSSFAHNRCHSRLRTSPRRGFECWKGWQPLCSRRNSRRRVCSASYLWLCCGRCRRMWPLLSTATTQHTQRDEHRLANSGCVISQVSRREIITSIILQNTRHFSLDRLNWKLKEVICDIILPLTGLIWQVLHHSTLTVHTLGSIRVSQAKNRRQEALHCIALKHCTAARDLKTSI